MSQPSKTDAAAKVIIAGMQNCGHCDSAKAAFANDPNFKFIQCQGANPIDANHPMAKHCQKVEGFPTFKKADGSTCAVGFGGNADEIRKKCL